MPSIVHDLTHLTTLSLGVKPEVKYKEFTNHLDLMDAYPVDDLLILMTVGKEREENKLWVGKVISSHNDNGSNLHLVKQLDASEISRVINNDKTTVNTIQSISEKHFKKK